MQSITSQYFSNILNNAHLTKFSSIYLVGGCVRDFMMHGEGFKPKDVDICIESYTVDEIIEKLSLTGRVDIVGKSFGVIKYLPFIDTNDPSKGLNRDLEIEISVPRIDKKGQGDGHKSIEVYFDPSVTITEDLGRRDLTINSMALFFEGNNTFRLIDPFNGVESIQNKTIEATSKISFEEDPLRMLRALQFASRFNFTIEDETAELVRINASRLETISRERILMEFEKGFKKSPEPMIFEALIRKFFTDTFNNMGLTMRPFNATKSPTESFEQFIWELFTNEDPLTSLQQRLSLSNHQAAMIELLDLLNLPFSSTREVVEMVMKNRKRFIQLFDQLDSLQFNMLVEQVMRRILRGDILLSPQQLAITTEDIISSGCAGPQIGQMQEELLLMVALGMTPNTSEALSGFLR